MGDPSGIAQESDYGAGSLRPAAPDSGPYRTARETTPDFLKSNLGWRYSGFERPM